MDLPAGSAQEYIRIAGIAAVYVARLPSGACRIGISRDLKRQDLDLTYVAAFWVDDIKVATRIASRVNKTIRHRRAKACGHPSMTYAQAHARLRQVMIRRKLAGKLVDPGVSILPLVFPELSQ